MTRNIDQLTAGQERMTREISKLQAVEQQIKPPPRSASASARKRVPDAAMVRRWWIRNRAA